MRRRLSPRGLLATGLLALLLSACDGGPPEPLSTAPSAASPPPTEHWLDEDAEARQKSLRREWFEERHQAPPEVDWREVERENGLEQIAKRNRLATSSVQNRGVWVERGSENQAGRMHVTVPSTDGTSLYGGSSKGGVWKGALDGSSWTPLGDNLYGGAHWLAVVPGDGPGDPDVVLAATDSGLVHVTRNEGLTWERPAAFASQVSNVRRVLVSSDGAYTAYVLLRNNNAYRLFRSTDGLRTFQIVHDMGGHPGDVWLDRTGGNALYLLTQNVVYRSTNQGNTWIPMGAPPGGAERGELTGSEAGAPRLWAVLRIGGNNELYRSDDAGVSWSYVTTITDYWQSLNASITDADLFAYGGVELWRTFDGGNGFAKQSNWWEYYGDPANRLHADIPGIDVWPHGPAGESWYVNTDGGLFRSQDGFTSFDNLSLTGLRVSQYYTTHTSAANPLHVAAGSQDQGYQWASTPAAPDHPRLDFDQLISGDYGHLTSGDGSHEYLFTTYPGFVLIHAGEDAPQLFSEDFPPGEDHAWMPPVVADPLDPRDFFLCASRIYHYERSTSANDWTYGQWSSFDFQATGGEYVSALTFSPLDVQRAYAVTNRGRLFHSDDQGVTWTPSTSTGPSGQYFYGTALLASSRDVDTVWVGGSGYGGPAVYQSTDGGVSFQPHGQGLPATLVYCLGEFPDGSGTLVCGTETSVYRRLRVEPGWADVTGNEAPVTTYWSVEALAHENTMRFGTYGRGIWDYRITRSGRAVRVDGVDLNPVVLTGTDLLQLGATWRPRVDPAPFGDVDWVGLVVYERPDSGRLLPGGELLVDLGSRRLYSGLVRASEGPPAFSVRIPDEASLVGLRPQAQAFGVGPRGLLLGNGLTLRIGR